MKKLLFALTLFCSVSLYASAVDPSQQVLNAFHKFFPYAKDIKWSENSSLAGALFGVSFQQGDMLCRITYDQEGNMLRSIRYYKEQNLPMQVVKSIKEEYPVQQIFGVVEVTMNNMVNYYVTLEDKKSWIDLRSDDAGNLYLKKIYHKG
ncbi:MAG: hypothetical protein ACM3VS_16540 [Candidatus Dadabacteria bacterium]